ncbi:hypothetical protein LEP1GSC089_2757 [Leptospira interrogans serovar Autumnalis str. LP101]|nr:hypothetical protein LEP1GSC089_1309 [Leptospira interrogans serovar Autumnalis str. LP101]EMN53694.1 hypothetical protein LEP1GSC089_0716 [Leptospira interrogans serovar Autumnalis str. LP101]EMN55076.1 hypothetical protein LEP1GSC089_2757 [Leptospira interrogans serovar Autumnalis str. LP101]EMN79384.1 hypothetical protein LEP1GSC106_0554 [Leptospira interrogans serovar Grippotyphosa str. UI 12764]
MILDLYSRKTVGWSLSDRNDSQLVCDTVSDEATAEKEIVGTMRWQSLSLVL